MKGHPIHMHQAAVLLGLLTATLAIAEPPPPTPPIRLLPQPLAASQIKDGPYELRYIESEPDAHLQLAIKTVKNQILLSDLSKLQLKGCTYVINGWTDPDDASRLTDEPIQPYTLYQVSKVSIDAPMREWWRAMPEFRKDNPVEIHRSEVFFVVLPKGETWNGAGESCNPIGRPLAFSQLPAFKLTDRVYGVDWTFESETDQRLDELDITFNRRRGRHHTMIYSGAITAFIHGKGYDKEPRRPVHDFTDQDCIDFADSLPAAAILAFDFEPPADMTWMIDYGHPNYHASMAKVIKRLDERGINAYNWIGSPQFRLDGESLQGFKNWGKGNEKMELFLNAYANPAAIDVDPTPNQVINVGFGYDPFDYNFLPTDGDRQNSSPQALYLKALDACELARRVYPDRELLAFTWGYMEFDVGTFPPNHVVEIPKLKAAARRTDNKPIYPPSSWHDSMTLAMVYCRYLFYWAGGGNWDPAHTARYAAKNVAPGELVYWHFIKGEAPEVKGASYPGKEALIYNATLSAAYRYSQIQDVCDAGERLTAATTYRRADRGGELADQKSYPAYTDGSQFLQAAMNRQPFTLVVRNPATGRAVVFFQDVWSRPGRATEFSFTLDGKTYTTMKGPDGKTRPLRTDGNRLFIGILETGL
jgi:hypothetical protein